MKPDVLNKLVLERDARQKLMPEFIYEYIASLDTTKEVSTQIEYMKDLEAFFTFLLEQEQFSNKEKKPRSYRETIQDFKVKDMELVKTKDIRNFLSSLTEYKKERKKKDGTTYMKTYTCSPVGQARKIATIHALYKYLIKNDFIKLDPSAKVEVKFPKRLGILPYLEADEVENYLETVSDIDSNSTDHEIHFNRILWLRDYSICLLFSHLGLRVSELVQIDITDINLEKDRVKVIRKGKKIQELTLPYDVLEPLSDYLKKRQEMKDIPVKYKDALFISLRKQRISPRTVRYMIDKYKKRAGINEKVTPHTFRRTFGTMLYNKTGDIELTRDALGHEIVETTRKNYVAIDKNRQTEILHNFTIKSESSDKKLDVDMDLIRKLSKKTGMSVEDILNEM